MLALQKILGHSMINMTRRYAYFSSERYVDAIKLNPFEGGCIK